MFILISKFNFTSLAFLFYETVLFSFTFLDAGTFFFFSFLLENEKQNIETAKSKLSLAMTCALRAAENNKKK